MATPRPFGSIPCAGRAGRLPISSVTPRGLAVLLLLMVVLPGCEGSRESEAPVDEPVRYRKEARDLGSADRQVKYDAYVRFYELGEEGIPALIEALEDPRPEARVRAARILVDFGSNRGVTVLLDGLAAEEPDVREIAVQGLTVFAYRSADEVAARLEDPDPRIRRGCLEVIRKSARWDLQTRLIPLLEDPDPAVRLEAVFAVGSFMPTGDPPFEIVDRLADPDQDVRRAARLAMLARGGYPGRIPSVDRLEELEEIVVTIREWLVEQRRVR